MIESFSMALRWVRIVCLLMALLAVFARVNNAAAEDVSTQLWSNLILGFPKSERLYLELDLGPG